jgi:alpha-tubulin suppressor-like RCC1 family protein
MVEGRLPSAIRIQVRWLGPPESPMIAFGSRLLATAFLLGSSHLLAQSSIRSASSDVWGTFDSLWNEQTDNLWVAAAHGVTLVGKADGSVQAWGRFAAAAPVLPPGVRYVGASFSHGPRVLRRSDGQLFVSGDLSGALGLQNVPALPPGVVYTAVAAAHRYILAVRSDGAMVGWGTASSGGLPDIPATIPALPAGVQYVDVGASPRFNEFAAFALRSDGTIVAWGTALPAPTLPAGTAYTGLRVGYYHAAAIRSDGMLVCWGNNTSGQCNVPALPPGVHYVQAAPAERHTLARRSDGVVVAFGDNTDGQCNVPTPPAGVSYVDVAGGGGPVIYWDVRHHSVALRSDGRVIAWGDNSVLQCNVPAPPAGLDYVEVAEADACVFARLNDGTLRAFGWNEYGDCNVPPLPPGVTYVEVDNRVARRSDGQVVAWGSSGLLAVPTLPAGTTYVEVAASQSHALARRSDGQVIAWGQGGHGQLLVPALPPNTTYVQIAAGGNNSMARRSDGVVVAWGDNSQGQCQVPWQLASRRCVQIACGWAMFALCSDGDLVMWGVPPTSGQGVPGLPFGVTYVGMSTSLARRSDGLLVSLRGFGVVDQPPAGRSSMEVAYAIARDGPTSTYVSFAPGCSGSRPATRLVPIDTPRLGADLEVTLFDLPLHLAIVCTGLSTTWSGTWPLPLSLGGLGMPGCTLFVACDHEALLRWTIPNVLALLGARFHQQALVPDPGAGNALQAVMSAATTAVLGR